MHDALIINVSSSKIRWGLVGIPFERIGRTAVEKMKALREAGIHVVDTPAAIGETIKRALAR